MKTENQMGTCLSRCLDPISIHYVTPCKRRWSNSAHTDTYEDDPDAWRSDTPELQSPPKLQSPPDTRLPDAPITRILV
jgi:hypothetical protein